MTSPSEAPRQPDKPPDFEWERGAAHVRGIAQAFFSDYATKIRAPHYGPLHREVIVELLKRAEEAQLYTPPKE